MIKILLHCIAIAFLGGIFLVCITTAVGHMRALVTVGDERHILGWLKYGALAAVAFVGATLNLAALCGWS